MGEGSVASRWMADDDEGMHRFVSIEDLFKGRHFDRQIIVLSVSWYTSFKLSLRDLVIMMAERGISLTHTTILRWVQRLCRLASAHARTSMARSRVDHDAGVGPVATAAAFTWLRRSARIALDMKAPSGLGPMCV